MYIQMNSSHRLVEFAAVESIHYIKKIFQQICEIECIEDDSSRHILYISTEKKDDNFHCNNEDFKLNNQEFYIKKIDNSCLMLCGGSPIALLWAVYELAQRWGVVYTFFDDVFEQSGEIRMFLDIDMKFSPQQKLRSWRVFDVLLSGPLSWTISQQKKVISQLVKMKFNGILINIWPSDPFIAPTIDGITRTTGILNLGMKFPVTRDNIGVEHLYISDNYINPEFKNCDTFTKLHEAVKSYTNRLMEAAKFFDMTITVSANIFSYSLDYTSLLDDPVIENQIGSASIYEGGDLLGEKSLRLINAHMQAYIEDFPQIDRFILLLSEHPRNSQSFSKSFESLTKRFKHLKGIDINAVLHNRPLCEITAGGYKRSIAEGKMTFVMLDAFYEVMDKTGTLNMLKDKGIKAGINMGISCPQIIPIMAEMLWNDADLVITPGYTSSRGARTMRVWDDIKNEDINLYMNITLQDDNVGPVPQISSSNIYRQIKAGTAQGMKGYYTRFWHLGTMDAMAKLLSDISWNEKMLPYESLQNYLEIFGAHNKEALLEAYRLLEDATLLLDVKLGLLFPIDYIIKNKINPESTEIMDDNKWHVLSIYLEIDNILKKAAKSIKGEQGRAHLKYFQSRISFAVQIIEGLINLEDANKLLADKKIQQAKVRYELTLERFKTATRTVADNIRDDSDRGLLAFCYHALVRVAANEIDAVLACEKDKDKV